MIPKNREPINPDILPYNPTQPDPRHLASIKSHLRETATTVENLKIHIAALKVQLEIVKANLHVFRFSLDERKGPLDPGCGQ